MQISIRRRDDQAVDSTGGHGVEKTVGQASRLSPFFNSFFGGFYFEPN
jgi:hypothetical protein